MVELDVTDIVKRYGQSFGTPGAPIGSIATMGANAATETFGNAQAAAPGCPELQAVPRTAMLEHFRCYGAWSDEELHQSTDEELRAMLLQDVLLTHMDDAERMTDSDGRVWFTVGGC